MQKTLVVTDNNFRQEILDSQIPVLVDFWASWCPPCKMVEPILEELSAELEGKVKVRKINVDQNRTLAFDFKVTGVPTFIVFDKGKELQRQVGARSRQQLLRMIVEAVHGAKQI